MWEEADLCRAALGLRTCMKACAPALVRWPWRAGPGLNAARWAPPLTASLAALGTPAAPRSNPVGPYSEHTQVGRLRSLFQGRLEGRIALGQITPDGIPHGRLRMGSLVPAEGVAVMQPTAGDNLRATPRNSGQGSGQGWISMRICKGLEPRRLTLTLTSPSPQP